MPTLADLAEVMLEVENGDQYLANGLVVRKDGENVRVVGRWDPPQD